MTFYKRSHDDILPKGIGIDTNSVDQIATYADHVPAVPENSDNRISLMVLDARDSAFIFVATSDLPFGKVDLPSQYGQRSALVTNEPSPIFDGGLLFSVHNQLSMDSAALMRKVVCEHGTIAIQFGLIVKEARVALDPTIDR